MYPLYILQLSILCSDTKIDGTVIYHPKYQFYDAAFSGAILTYDGRNVDIETALRLNPKEFLIYRVDISTTLTYCPNAS